MKKIFILITLLTSLFATALAQPVIKNQRTIGGNFEDYLQDIHPTTDGGEIVGGWSWSDISGEKTENSRGANDYWVVKLGSLGNIQWDKTIGGYWEDYFQALQQTSDEGYILAGYSYSNQSPEKSENSRGDADYWIIKLNSRGDIQWDKTIGGGYTDVLTSVQQTSDGGYILGGYSNSNPSGEKTENSRGDVDFWVVKVNNHGNIQWDKTIGGNSNDYLESLQQTTDGGYILGGSSWSDISGEKTENSRGSNDYWIVKLDNAGNIKWDKTIGGTNSDVFTSLRQTGDGGYIVGGQSLSNKSGEKTEDRRGRDDYWVIKLDPIGNIKWDKTIGGDKWDRLQALQQTKDDGYILGGYSDSEASGEKTENSKGGEDYWVVKLNKYGKFEWDKTIGGIDHDHLTDIIETERNRFILGGSSSSGVSGDKTDPSRGYSDYWLVKLNYAERHGMGVHSPEINYSNIIQNNSSNKGFTIYPNPVKDILYIRLIGTVAFAITDQTGKVLITKTITDKGEIEISTLSAGMYYIKNTATGETQKVIVSK